MTLPTKDAKGNALTDNLTIKVFRDNEKTPVKTFTSIQPGESCNFTDNTVGAGRHTYTVVTVNKKDENLVCAGVVVKHTPSITSTV